MEISNCSRKVYEFVEFLFHFNFFYFFQNIRLDNSGWRCCNNNFSPSDRRWTFCFKTKLFLLAFEFINLFSTWSFLENGFKIQMGECFSFHARFAMLNAEWKSFVLSFFAEYYDFQISLQFCIEMMELSPKINTLTMTNWSKRDDIHWQWVSKNRINGIRFKWMMQQIWDTASNHLIVTLSTQSEALSPRV